MASNALILGSLAALVSLAVVGIAVSAGTAKPKSTKPPSPTPDPQPPSPDPQPSPGEKLGGHGDMITDVPSDQPAPMMLFINPHHDPEMHSLLWYPGARNIQIRHPAKYHELFSEAGKPDVAAWAAAVQAMATVLGELTAQYPTTRIVAMGKHSAATMAILLAAQGLVDAVVVLSDTDPKIFTFLDANPPTLHPVDFYGIVSSWDKGDLEKVAARFPAGVVVEVLSWDKPWNLNLRLFIDELAFKALSS